jgi:hypothetical protein
VFTETTTFHHIDSSAFCPGPDHFPFHPQMMSSSGPGHNRVLEVAGSLFSFPPDKASMDTQFCGAEHFLGFLEGGRFPPAAI